MNSTNRWSLGTCRAPGLPQPEILPESETKSLPTEESNLDEAYDELETIKQHLLALRSRLVRSHAEPCATVAPPEDATCCSDSMRQLLELSRRNCILQCQMRHLTQHLLTTQRRLKAYERERCQLADGIRKMRQEMELFETFKLNTQHHFGLCIERFEQLKSVKMNGNEMLKFMNKFMLSKVALTQSLVPLHCHEIGRKHFRMQAMMLRMLMQMLLDNFQDEWKSYENRLKFNTVPAIFYTYN